VNSTAIAQWPCHGLFVFRNDASELILYAGQTKLYLSDTWAELTNGGADIVYEASSSKPGVMLASSILRQPAPRCGHGTNYPMGGMQNSHHFWPRLVYQAGYLFKVEITPGELTGGEGAIVLKPNDRTVGDRLQVIEQIRLGNLPVEDFVDKPTPVEDAPQAYLTLRDHPEAVSAIAFKW
jgi:threonine dehydrogenase-like Zn-dependent dehydrogenase